MRPENIKPLVSVFLALLLHCWPGSTIGAEESGINSPSQFIDPNGFVLIDGKPRLIIGIYGTQSDEQLKQLAESGYNLVVQVWPATSESLDRLQQARFVWMRESPL